MSMRQGKCLGILKEIIELKIQKVCRVKGTDTVDPMGRGMGIGESIDGLWIASINLTD